MKFKDFKLRADNHFVAMEYYGWILNRTFLILLTPDTIMGIKANGFIVGPVDTGVDGLVNDMFYELTLLLAVHGNLYNPHSYIKAKYIRRVQECDLFDGSILTANRSNFIIKRSDIQSATYNPRKKWAMGNYPHDGKVYIRTTNRKKREFIIVGGQSGHNIAFMLQR